MGGTSQGARKAALTKGLQSGILPEEKDYGQNPYSKVHIPFSENNEEEVPRKIPARTITKSGNPQDNIPRITKSGTSYEGSLMKELRNDIREFYTKTQSYEKVLSELKVKSDESEDPNQKQEYITSMEKLKLKHGIAERRLKQAVREYRKLRQRGEQESQRSKWLLENVAKMSLVESLIAKENKVKGWWNRLSKHDKIYHLNNLKGAGGGWDKDEYVKRGKHLNYHDFSPALKQYIDIYYDELVRGNMLNPPRMQHWKKIYGNNAREEYPTEDIDWEIDRAEQQIRMSKGHHLLNPMFKEKLKTLKKLKRQGYTKVKVSGNDYVGVENALSDKDMKAKLLQNFKRETGTSSGFEDWYNDYMKMFKKATKQEKLDAIYNDKKKAQASGTTQGAIKAWKKRKRGGGKDEDEDLQKQHDKLGDKIDSLYSKNYYDKLQEVDRKIEQLRHDKDWKTIPKSKWSDKKLALYDKLKQKYAELSRKDKENDKEIDKLEKMQDKLQSRIDAKPDSDLNISNRRHQAEYEDALNNTKFGEYVEDYMGGFKTVSVKGGTNSMASLKPTKITMPKEKIRFGDHAGTMIFKIQQGNELLEPHFITFNKLSKASRNNKAYQKIRSELTLKAKDLNQNMYGGVIDLTDYIAGNFDVFYKHGVTGGIDDMSQYNQSSEDKELAEDWLNEVVDILGVDLDHIDPSDFVETHAPDLLEDYGKDDDDDFDDDD